MSRYANRVVNCDATYDVASGVGFVAVTGALGSHVRRVECHSCVAAETLAIMFALELAEFGEGRAPRLIFRTDCQPVAIGIQPGVKANRDRRLGSLFAQVRRTLAHRRQFEVQHVDRGKVGASHALASRARRAYRAGVPGSAIEVFLAVPELSTTVACEVWE